MSTAQDHKERGNAYYQRKEYDAAVEWYTRSLDVDGDQHATYTNRAAAHFALNNYEDALSDALKSTELNDSWTKGYYRQGTSLVAMERYDEAIEAYKTGIAKDPTNSQVRNTSACITRGAGRHVVYIHTLCIFTFL